MAGKVRDNNVPFLTHTIPTGEVTGPQISSSAFLAGHFAGRNGAGAVTLSGAKIGDKVLICTNLTDAANGAAAFEGTITVNGQIQQSSASDLSAKNYSILLLVQS